MSLLHLRNVPDTDPTEYVGGFIGTGGGAPDETRAYKSSCSSYVDSKFVPGAGVKTMDLFTVSAGGALKLGIPPIASVDASADRGTTVLVKYTHTGTWQARVSDPAGFASCCANYPGECPSAYIGDFIGGKDGTIYTEQSARAKGKVGGVSPAVSGEVVAYAGKQWVHSVEFPNDVAFAFKLKDPPLARSFEDPICKTDWVRSPPSDPRGHWEVAISDVEPDASGARTNAWDHAALQVAKWCGADTSTITAGARTEEGAGAGADVHIATSNAWSVTAKALVSKMRLVCVVPEKAEGPRGFDYRDSGLYLLPQAEIEPTCKAARDGLGSAR
jgi:hypothetical protein